MKKLFLATTVITLLVSSGFASAIEVFKGEIKGEIGSSTRSLEFNKSYDNVNIVVDSSLDHPVLTLKLIGESREKLEDYINAWEIEIAGAKHAKMKLSPRGFFAKSNCSVLSLNGVYTSLKGVCAEGLILTVPANYDTELSHGNQLIFLKNRDEQASTAPSMGTMVDSESIQQLKEDLEDATFKSDKTRVLERFVKTQVDDGRNEISAEALANIAEVGSFDDDKILIVQKLKIFIKDPVKTYSAVEEMMSFSSGKRKLKELLLN